MLDLSFQMCVPINKSKGNIAKLKHPYSIYWSQLAAWELSRYNFPYMVVPR